MKRLFLITAALVASLFTLQAQTWVRFGTDNTSSGLPSDEVYDLEFDGQGTLWAATNKGVALLKGGVWTMLQGMQALEGKAVNQLFLDKNKNMWLAANEEGLAMRSPQGEWTFYTTESGDLEGGFTQDILEDEKGGYWVADGATLTYIKGAERTHYHPASNPFTTFTTLAIGKDGKVWAGCESGVYYFEGTEWKLLEESNTFGSIQDITTREGDVWIASQNGLQHFDGTRWSTQTTENGLPDNFLTTVMFDAKGRLWVGTDGFGVCHQEGGKWLLIGENEGLHAKDIFDITFSSEGKAYLATHKTGVAYQTESNTWALYSGDGLVGNVCKDIVLSNGGSFWVATTSGISHYDATGKKWKSFTQANGGLIGLNARRLSLDAKGQLWAAFYDGGVSVYNPTMEMWTNHGVGEGKLPVGTVTDVWVDAEGVAWVTTFSGGLAKYANNKWETIKQEQGLPTNSLLGITPGADGSLWLSSVAGAIQYKGEKFTALTKSEHKLPDDNVRNILFASDGSMYICTNTGLQVRNLTTNEYTNYGASNGFISGYVNHVAFDAKGNRWISCWTEGFYLMTKEGVFYKIGATEGFTPTDVYMARFNEKGELYVCTNDGIFILKNPDTLVQKLTSTEATLPSHSLIVAPNPASSYTELQGANAHVEVRLTTLDGVLLRKMQCDAQGSLRIGLEGVTPGTYVLVVGSKAYRLLVSE